MEQSVLDQAPARSLQPRPSRSRWTLFVTLAVLVSAVSAAIIFPRIATTEFSVDEPGWIASGYYYTALVQKGDINWDHWFCRECQGFGRLNLHVGQYLYGVPLKLEQKKGEQDFLGFYLVEHSYDQNVREGLVPPLAILREARQISAFFGVLCCVIIFAIGFWAYNPWVGIIAAGLLMTNAVFLKIAAQAMTDTFYNFFLMSICLTLIIIAKVRKQKTVLLLACVAGFLTAMACSVKITGLLVGSGFFLGALAWRYLRERVAVKDMALTVGAFFAVALFTVYLLNPFFWPSYHAVVWQEGKALVHDISTKKIVPWHRTDLESAAFTYPEVRDLSHPLEFPLLFGRWSHELQRHIDEGWAMWDGPRLPVLHASLFRQAVPFAGTSRTVPVSLAGLVLAVFTFVGIYYLVRSAKADSRHVVLLIALIVNYLLIVLFMKLNWDRYYLPTMTSVDVIAGVGLYELVRRIANRGREEGSLSA